MEFPFSTGVQYLDHHEKEAFARFLKEGPEVNHEYTNNGGKKRLVVRLWYPEGVITELTAYHPDTFQGARRYHTPLATLTDSKYARVTYHSTDGNGQCTSEEWFQWLGGDWKEAVVETPPENPADVAARNMAMKAMTGARVTPEEYDRVKEGKKWTPRGRTK